jgi:hypothetical protein
VALGICTLEDEEKFVFEDVAFWGIIHFVFDCDEFERCRQAGFFFKFPCRSFEDCFSPGYFSADKAVESEIRLFEPLLKKVLFGFAFCADDDNSYFGLSFEFLLLGVEPVCEFFAIGGEAIAAV